ncbi:hypothetical protein [Ralstonia sp. SET104]|uniref:hypothetical protein n=1 Tax=Ralstonia sp. SET104 TaxID=2448774 RepID=UPI000F58ABF0|nr:hypothetical protein [Ralstonia sp. SET104]GCB02521.1 hypothetical protein PSUB009319_01520 [Ralstonia sp. SET104]
MNRLRPTLRGPHQRDDLPGGTTPPRAPGAGRSAENIDKVLGKPEHGKPASGSADRLPHERDQHLEEQRSEPRSDVEQAARDIESGLLDTDLHNTPGVERVVRERHAANREDSDRQVANRSADDLADKRGQTGRPSHSRDERKG